MAAFNLESRIYFDGAAVVTADASISSENSIVDTPLLDQQTTSLLQSLSEVSQVSDNNFSADEKSQISELVFVDSHIADYSQFFSLSSVNIDVVSLDANQDGLTQVAAITQNYSGLTNIRIITNIGDSGFELGSTVLSQNDFSTRTADIAEISQCINANGLLSFYSADNSSYLAGHDFVEKLAIFAGSTGEFEAKKVIDANSVLDDGKHEIVFIDSNLTNWQQLVDSARSGVEVVLINGQGDGLKEIANYVSGQSQIDAIHIVSHASRGELFIGSLDVTTANIGDYQQSFADIGSVLASDGDLLLYGCYLGEGPSGQAFLDQIAGASGVSVAASNDLTGPDNLGGNWVLEATSGNILTAGAFDTNLVQQYQLDLGGSYTITGGVNVDTSKSTIGLIGAGKQITFDPITITAGSTAQLILNAYDVDFGLKDSSGNQYPIGHANSEWDGVYIARVPDQNMTTATSVISAGTQPTWTFIGYLTGSNNTWNYTSFDVSAYVAAHGGTGRYVVRVTPDDNGAQTQANNGGRWVVGVASAQIIVDGGAHTATLSNITESAAAVSSMVTATTAGTYTVEYNLMDAAGHVVATYTKTVPLAANVGTVVGGTLAVNSNFYNTWSALPSGNYTLKVTLLDANGTAQDTGSLPYTNITSSSLPSTGIAALVTDLDTASWTGSSVADIQHIATTDTSPNVLGKLSAVASTTAVSYVDVYVDGVFVGTSSVAANSTAWSIQFGSATSGLNKSTQLLSPGNHAITAVYANAAKSVVSVNYTSSSSPVTLDPNISIVDSGSTNIYRVYVRLGTTVAGDTLTYSTTGTSISGSYSSGVLTFSSSAGDTAANFQTVLRTIKYSSSSSDPTNGGLNTSRTVNWQIRYISGSGNNTSNKNYSAVKTTNIAIAPQDTAPILTVNGSPEASVYYAGDPSVTVNSAITIKDDGNTLASATVSITTGFQSSSDSLAFANNNSSQFGNIVGNYDASTGRLSLSSAGATATVTQWSAALAAVTYSNNSLSPSAGSRTISFAVDDGTATNHLSNTVTSAVTISAVSSANHAPVLSVGGNVVEINSKNTSYIVNSGIQLIDDNTTLSSASINIVGYSSGDTLAFTANSSLYGNISSSYSNGTLTLTSSGKTATIAQWQAALRSVKFSTSSTISSSSFASKAVVFKIDDGQTNNHVSNSVVTRLSIGGIKTNNNSTTSSNPAVSLDVGSGSLVLQSTSFSSSAPSYALLIDTASQITPTITAIDSIDDLHTTTDRTPTISGTSAAGITLDVFLDGNKIGTTVSDLSGKWTFSLAGVQSLATSAYTFTVQDTLNAKTSTNYDLAVTAQTPDTKISINYISADTGSSPTDFVTSQALQTIGATLTNTLNIGSETLWGSLDSGLTWTDVTSKVSGTMVMWSSATLLPGYSDPNNYVRNTIQLKVQNSAGDGNVAVHDYLLIGSIADPIITKTNFLSAGTPTLVGTADPNSVLTIQYFDGTGSKTGYAQPDVNGNWSFTIPNPLSDGSYFFNVTASDPFTGASAVHSASTTVRIDTSIPLPANIHILNDTAGASSSDFITSIATQTITATLFNASNQATSLASGQTLWGSVDGGLTWTDITTSVNGSSISWAKTLPVGASAIDFQVRNLSSGAMGGIAEQTYVVDTTKPTLSAANAVIDLYTNTIRLTFTETGSGLDLSSVPLYSNFTLKQNNTTLSLSAANTAITMVDATTVKIALTGFTLLSSDTFTLTYSGTSLRDVAGNQVDLISSLALTNPIYLHATNDTGAAIELGSQVAGSDAEGNLISNDQGSSLTVTSIDTGSSLSNTPIDVAGVVDIVGTYGTLTINTDGSYTYVVDNTNTTVNALNTGSTPLTDTFIYELTDSTLNTATATLVVSISGTNDAPTVSAGTASATLIEAGGIVNANSGTASAAINITKADVDGTASYDTNYLTSNGWSAVNSGISYTKMAFTGQLH